MEIQPPKLRTHEEICAIVENYRKEQKRIVTTNGVFDMLHPGHVYSLTTARSYGDVLIVCLNSDSSVKRLKGPERPIWSQHERAYVLSGLESVSDIVIFEEDDPRAILSLIKPDIHVKSKTGYKGIEAEVISSGGGRVELIEDMPGYSTTGTINGIRRS